MKVDWRTVSKWLLLVPAIAFSTIAAYIFIEFSFLLDPLAMTLASTLQINSAPTLILRPFTLLTVFLAISLWILPPALVIRFALRALLLAMELCDLIRSACGIRLGLQRRGSTSCGSRVHVDTPHCGKTRFGPKTLVE
jgi:hypothetical protein